jgi:chaperone required for assembly of F1-ATPase
MREFLEDAEGHRDDGYGRAQAHAKRQLPKRFYAEAAVKAVEGGYAVGLDGRVPKTPGMKPVVVPS